MVSSPMVTSDGIAPPRPRLAGWLAAAMLLLVSAGLAAALLELGYYQPPGGLSIGLLHVAQAAAAALILAVSAAGILAGENRWMRLRNAWPELLALGCAVAVGVLVTEGPRWLAVIQAYLIFSALAYIGRLAAQAVQAGMEPAVMFVGGFLFLILAGAALLWLPRALPENTTQRYFGDALFTAVSAACVTGLSLDMGAEYTRFGQWILLFLVQVGGLSIIVAGTILVLRGGRLIARGDLGAPLAAPAGGQGEAMRLAGPADLPAATGQIVESVVLTTLLIELIGACFLVRVWGVGRPAVFAAVFHSVMAFCSAGYALQKSSLISLRDQWPIMVVIPLLTLLGGLGLPVILELARGAPATLKHLGGRLLGLDRLSPLPGLSLQTRIVLASTLLLVVLGPLGILALDPAQPPKSVGQAQDTMAGLKGDAALNDWQRLPLERRIAQSWFLGAEARSGGLVTMDLNELTSAGKLWVILLMVIGGSPASAAGGLKTLTLVILLGVIWSTLRGRRQPSLLGRPLAPALVERTLTLAGLYLACFLVGTVTLAVTQGPTSRFMDVLFEAASALGTAGLSLGETLRLKTESKFVISALMLLGRLGPLVLLISLAPRGPAGQGEGADELVLA